MADAGQPDPTSSVATAFVNARLALLRQQDAEVLRAANPRKTILSEEQYVDAMDAIITRDFFPDLPRLRAKLDYLDALEGRDPARLAAAEEHLLASGTPATPAAATPRQGHRPGGAAPPPDAGADGPPTLDRFLARFTSEDNASFAEISARMLEAHRAKYWWADPAAHRRRLRLLGPNGEARAPSPARDADPGAAPPGSGAGAGALTVKGDTRPTSLDFAPTRRTNALFFQPESAAPPAGGATLMGPPKALDPRRTRFSTAQLASLRTAAPPESGAPRAGTPGARLVPSTPALTPGGAGESPLMTWGQVASTPLLLQPLDVALPGDEGAQHAPRYRVPNQPRREAASHRLADSRRAGGAATRPSPSPRAVRAGRAATPSLSAAGAKLAKALGRTGSAARHELGFSSELRASYGGATPRAPAPTASAQATPSSSAAGTPSAAQGGQARSQLRAARAGAEPGREAAAQPGGPGGKRPRTDATPHAAELTDGLLKF